MSLPRSGKPRSARSDTKTLYGLGGDGMADSGTIPVAAAQSAAAAGEPTEPAGADEGERHAVELRFKGVDEPVRARAIVQDAQLLLRADLPFLELDSPVTVDRGDGVELHGRIRHVSFAPGIDRRIPQLCVELALADAPTESASDDSAEAATVRQAPPSHGPARAPQVTRHGARMRALLGWLAALTFGAAGGAGVVFVWLTPGLSVLPQRFALLQRSTRAQPAARTVRVAVPASYVPRFDVAREVQPVPPEVLLPLEAPLAPFELAPPLAGEAEPAPPGAEPPPADAAPGAEAAPSAEAAQPAAAAQAADDSATFSADEAAQPEVTVDGGTTRVFVPMRGDGAGLQQSELATPGVAVTLPHARALIPAGNHAVRRGHVRRIWVRPDGEGVQVRVITRRRASSATAAYDERGLTIVLSP